MNLFRLRQKKINARPKAISALVIALISGLLVSIPAPANAAACVPTSTTVGTDTVLTFSTAGSCEWDAPIGITAVRVLVVGGGSSGGAGQAGVWWPQGGGGGAVVQQSSFATTPGQSISVTVGGGGDSIETQSVSSTLVNNGGQSSFADLSAPGGVAPVTHGGNGGTSGNGSIGGGGSSPTSGGGGGAGGGGNGTMTGFNYYAADVNESDNITDDEMRFVRNIIYRQELLDIFGLEEFNDHKIDNAIYLLYEKLKYSEEMRKCMLKFAEMAFCID